ncbi:MAG: phosphoribosylformylglycinamidine cyclo-ligase [Candidatus Omnitrophica bacterium]|nr:phosphoribosylformylglycinamidine cyclo-ligase [Candidatus Omnitrophota bacterium]
MKNITYKKAGVDIKKAATFKQKIKYLVRSSFSPEVLKDIGGFGGFFKFAKEGYKEPVLVASSDGVGTKLKIATLVNKHDTVGIDAVAMNTNDILCAGAKPLFFLDYIAFSNLEEDILFDVVKGLNKGCIESGCALIGGETAQMPGVYKKGEYDLAGFCVGVVEKKAIIDGSGIEAGDAVIGLESSGLHSNGFSLVRKVFSETELKCMSRELLKPTRIYVKPILSLLTCQSAKSVHYQIKGIAHITGGSFYDKISRILPDNVNVRIRKNSWVVPQIFKLIQNKGSIADTEMYHTLNMGIGMVLIVEPLSLQPVIAKLAESRVKSWFIGEVVRGKKEVEII